MNNNKAAFHNRLNSRIQKEPAMLRYHVNKLLPFGVSLLVNSILITPTCLGVVTSTWKSTEKKEEAEHQRRRVSVADCIRMARFAKTGEGFSPNTVQFSPDRKRFVVVIKRGNLEKNTVDYSLYLWRTAQAFDSPEQDVLVTLSSSSNREAIRDVRWLDNTTITFLGENPGQLQQVYRFNLPTRRLSRVTSHPTNVAAYATSADGGIVVFAAKPSAPDLFSEKSRREGIRISNQFITDLIAGDTGVGSGDHEIFIQRKNTDTAIPVHKEGRLLARPEIRLSLSPDGRYLLVPLEVSAVPESWRDYQHPYIQQLTHQRSNVSLGFIEHYMLFDLATKTSKPLIDGPIGWTGSEVAWAPDSRSVVVSDIYLPLAVKDTVERKSRESNAFAVEVTIPTGEIKTISNEDLKLLRWDAERNDVLFANWRIKFLSGTKVEKTYFHKKGESWEVIKPDPQSGRAGQLEIVLEEDLNTPPRIVAIDTQTQKKALLLDLNPQFGEVNFGEVKEITWKATDSKEVQGGLYLPPDYISGQKYPLVIQTHGFTRNKFWIDGPWPTAFAAQPLAAMGFVVLQADQILDHDGKQNEGPDELASYEGAIRYLDTMGLIDKTRVGIVGFSRTCFHVKYALTHSTHFAAAVVADGIDAGYFQYIATLNARPDVASDYEALNGSLPFGSGLSSWFRNSPGFALDKVESPLLIEALGRSLLSEWEWFSGLSRLGKPVDMIFLPDAPHILVKPWEQMTSQQLTRDWFCFWLRGEEDPDPGKAEQYKRWRELRKVQKANQEAKHLN